MIRVLCRRAKSTSFVSILGRPARRGNHVLPIAVKLHPGPLLNIGAILSCRFNVPPESIDPPTSPAPSLSVDTADRFGSLTLSTTSTLPSFQLKQLNGVLLDLDSPCPPPPPLCAELHGLHLGRLYHPNSLSSKPVTPNHPWKYALSAGKEAQMIATFVSTAVETQDARASQEMS